MSYIRSSMLKSGMKRRVLVVAETDALRTGTERLLQNRGHTTYSASNVKEARQRAAAYWPDVILVEPGLHLPQDGLPPILPMRSNARETLQALDELIQSLGPLKPGPKPYSTTQKEPASSAIPDPVEVAELAALADRAFQRGRITRYELRGGRFRIVTRQAEFSFSCQEARAFLQEILTAPGHRLQSKESAG